MTAPSPGDLEPLITAYLLDQLGEEERARTERLLAGGSPGGPPGRADQPDHRGSPGGAPPRLRGGGVLLPARAARGDPGPARRSPLPVRRGVPWYVPIAAAACLVLSLTLVVLTSQVGARFDAAESPASGASLEGSQQAMPSSTARPSAAAAGTEEFLSESLSESREAAVQDLERGFSAGDGGRDRSSARRLFENATPGPADVSLNRVGDRFARGERIRTDFETAPMAQEAKTVVDELSRVPQLRGQPIDGRAAAGPSLPAHSAQPAREAQAPMAGKPVAILEDILSIAGQEAGLGFRTAGDMLGTAFSSNGSIEAGESLQKALPEQAEISDYSRAYFADGIVEGRATVLERERLRSVEKAEAAAREAELGQRLALGLEAREPVRNFGLSQEEVLEFEPAARPEQAPDADGDALHYSFGMPAQESADASLETAAEGEHWGIGQQVDFYQSAGGLQPATGAILPEAAPEPPAGAAGRSWSREAGNRAGTDAAPFLGEALAGEGAPGADAAMDRLYGEALEAGDSGGYGGLGGGGFGGGGSFGDAWSGGRFGGRTAQERQSFDIPDPAGGGHGERSGTGEEGADGFGVFLADREEAEQRGRSRALEDASGLAIGALASLSPGDDGGSVAAASGTAPEPGPEDLPKQPMDEVRTRGADLFFSMQPRFGETETAAPSEEIALGGLAMEGMAFDSGLAVQWDELREAPQKWSFQEGSGLGAASAMEALPAPAGELAQELEELQAGLFAEAPRPETAYRFQKEQDSAARAAEPDLAELDFAGGAPGAIAAERAGEVRLGEMVQDPQVELPALGESFGRDPGREAATRRRLARKKGAEAGRTEISLGRVLEEPAARYSVEAEPAAAFQREKSARQEPVSTFSLNVGDVSFQLARTSLGAGSWPDRASIRPEEFFNAFAYNDPLPLKEVPVALIAERALSPFGHGQEILRIGVRTRFSGRGRQTPLNLVLLLDGSGSMERPDRRLIVRKCLDSLADSLEDRDQISIVRFARQARIWGERIPGSRAREELERIRSLVPEGGTNLEEALLLAYQTARKHFLPRGSTGWSCSPTGPPTWATPTPGAFRIW